MHYKIISHLNIILCFQSISQLMIGDLVSFYVKNKKHIGIIIDICEEYHEFKLNNIEFLHRFGENYGKFINQFRYYYCCHPYSIMNNIKKFWSINKLSSKHQEHQTTRPITLNNVQQLCIEDYYNKCNKPVLLWGVTGSGKTEIAIQIAINCINNNQQVLILVPEIALTTNLVNRFKKYFEIDICVWNSQSQNKRKFQSIINNKSKLIIGARSAILLPYANLGLIIIDEEHDKSYKQMSDIHYCAINCSILKHHIDNNVKILLMSATPSLTSLYHTVENTYNLIYVNNPFYENNKTTTTVYTPNNILLNKYSQERLEEEINKGRQVMIFLNRRGFAHTLLCKICDFVQKCPSCNVNIIYHYDSSSNKSVFLCHKCNKKYPVNNCINCSAHNHIGVFGHGVEKVASVLGKMSNDKYKIGIFNSDYCYDEKSINDFLDKVKKHDINIIVGTQMLSKGHDFFDLSLVIILMYNLCSHDFKMQENLMQNLMQISGRVGRNNFKSEVIIQTPYLNNQYNLAPDYYKKFLYDELEMRKVWKLPPFTITIFITPNNLQDLELFMNLLKKLSVEIYTSQKKTLVIIIERSNMNEFLDCIHKNILHKHEFTIDIND